MSYVSPRLRYFVSRKPGTVLVVLVELDGGIAPLAVLIEKLPSLRTYRVVAPSGASRTVARAGAVLEDLPAQQWVDAVDVASIRAVVRMDEGLLGSADGALLLATLRGAGVAAPTSAALAERRAGRLQAAEKAEAVLGFKVV